MSVSVVRLTAALAKLDLSEKLIRYLTGAFIEYHDHGFDNEDPWSDRVADPPPGDPPLDPRFGDPALDQEEIDSFFREYGAGMP